MSEQRPLPSKPAPAANGVSGAPSDGAIEVAIDEGEPEVSPPKAAKPPDAPPPSTSEPGVVRPGAETIKRSRAKVTLKIPDDEISRPQITPAPPPVKPEPAPEPPLVPMTPMRIISIEQPASAKAPLAPVPAPPPPAPRAPAPPAAGPAPGTTPVREDSWTPYQPSVADRSPQPPAVPPPPPPAPAPPRPARSSQTSVPPPGSTPLAPSRASHHSAAPPAPSSPAFAPVVPPPAPTAPMPPAPPTEPRDSMEDIPITESIDEPAPSSGEIEVDEDSRPTKISAAAATPAAPAVQNAVTPAVSAVAPVPPPPVVAAPAPSPAPLQVAPPPPPPVAAIAPSPVAAPPPAAVIPLPPPPLAPLPAAGPIAPSPPRVSAVPAVQPPPVVSPAVPPPPVVSPAVQLSPAVQPAAVTSPAVQLPPGMNLKDLPPMRALAPTEPEGLEVKFEDEEVTTPSARASEPDTEIAAEDLVSVESAPAPKPPLMVETPARPFAPIAPVGATAAGPVAVRAASVPPPPSAAKAPPSQRVSAPRVIVPSASSALAPPPMSEVAPTGRRKARPWWEELFNDDFIRTMAKISDAQIGKEVDFVEESLAVAKGAMLLDLACGTGRHAIELTRRGYKVVGFDLSLPMLAKAAEEAQERGQKLNFVQGDMREMTFEDTFDGIYCWNTSFGFFEEDKNAQVIQRVHKALKKGGQFLLEVQNRDYIIRQAPSLAWFEGDGCICMDEMSIDWITSRMKVKRTMMMDDGRTKEIDYSVRIYALHELGKVLHDAGFRVAEVSGRTATPGVFFGSESPRTMILAEKK